MKPFSNAVAAGLLLFGLSVSAQQPWTVKQEWVRGHENFLASDAMRGRGSATHDEEVTATYVASEFEGYGLQHAPGMNSYIQAAELAMPTLNGHAKMTVGDLTFEEGKDFDMITSAGTSRSGRLLKVMPAGFDRVKDANDNVVFVSGTVSGQPTLSALRGLAGSGTGVVIVEADESTRKAYTMMNGGKTRLPIHLAEDTDQPKKHAAMTILAMEPEAYQRMMAAKEGTNVALNLFGIPTKRMTYNAIGYLPGTDPAAGTLLLSAHLDHLGLGKAVDGDTIWNGANDDAAGTTAVLELAHALAAGPRLKRSVLFVCYGSEELGEFGSTYFGKHPPVPINQLVANLEFEMIGNQDPKMPKGVLLLTGWERSNLGPTLKEHGALLGPDPYPEEHFFERSDNYQLALKGVVAHTAAGWGTPPTYHHPTDDVAHLNVPFMTDAIQSLVEPMRWLASSDFVPKWNHGGKPTEE